MGILWKITKTVFIITGATVWFGAIGAAIKVNNGDIKVEKF